MKIRFWSVVVGENFVFYEAYEEVGVARPHFGSHCNFVPISKKSDEFTTRQDVEKFLRRVQLKAFFHNKEDKSDNTEKHAFETLTARKSKWTPPEGQFASIDYFTKKCRHDVHKLKSNCNTKISNLFKEEWTALINLKNRNDLVIKAADKGGRTVVWRTDLYQQEAIRQLSDPTFYTKVNKDLTPANQKIVKDTIQELITKQELPVTAQNLTITTPRTSCIYFKPKIHKPNNPGRPIVSACSCPIAIAIARQSSLQEKYVYLIDILSFVQKLRK